MTVGELPRAGGPSPVAFGGIGPAEGPQPARSGSHAPARQRSLTVRSVLVGALFAAAI